jgi:hypothetical protein
MNKQWTLIIKTQDGCQYQTTDEWENIWTWLSRFIENNFKESRGMLLDMSSMFGSITIDRLYEFNRSN